MMTKNERAAVSRRRLRSALRKLRVEAEQTQKDVADALFWSPSKVMRIEAGQVGVTPTDVQALLKHYNVAAPAAQPILDLAIGLSKDKGTSGRYGDALTKEFSDFLEQEQAASVIRQYETKWIPGPLQTQSYARAAIRNFLLAQSEKVDEDVLETRITARTERQDMLVQGNAKAHFIMDESVLWRAVGAEMRQPELMLEQLRHLKTLAEQPNIDIQFMRLADGAYTSLLGPFVILEFDADLVVSNLLYLENPEGEILVRENPDQTAPYLDRFSQMEELATPVDMVHECVDLVLHELQKGSFGLGGLRA